MCFSIVSLTDFLNRFMNYVSKEITFVPIVYDTRANYNVVFGMLGNSVVSLPAFPSPSPFLPFPFFKSLNINQVKVEQRFIQVDVAWNCSATWRGLKAVPCEFKITSVKLIRSQASLAKRKGSNTVLSFSM